MAALRSNNGMTCSRKYSSRALRSKRISSLYFSCIGLPVRLALAYILLPWRSVLLLHADKLLAYPYSDAAVGACLSVRSGARQFFCPVLASKDDNLVESVLVGYALGDGYRDSVFVVHMLDLKRTSKKCAVRIHMG